ncbi:DUF3291 domain-containing protein [Solirubrobacter taibaiensis]|nr:DUF3291 domain-containing protein [Solirubrobacter taibaiensis]
MLRLPWITANSAAPDREILVMASRFHLCSPRHVPEFLISSLRICWQAYRAPGVLGLRLHANPFTRTFLTLSAWEDRETLMMFVVRDPHRTIMRRFRDHTDESAFEFWTAESIDLPISWGDARERLSGEKPRA